MRFKGLKKTPLKAGAEVHINADDDLPDVKQRPGEGMAEKAPEKKASRGRRARKPQTAPDGGASAA